MVVGSGMQATSLGRARARPFAPRTASADGKHIIVNDPAASSGVVHLKRDGVFRAPVPWSDPVHGRKRSMRVTGAGVNRAVLLAAGCLMVAVSACGSTSKASPPARTGGTAQATAGSDTVLATVEGQTITASEVRKALGQNLSKLEEQAYELKKQQVEELIADKLLAAEAARRGTTVESLVQQEITAKVAPVTESDIASFVAANRSRIPGDPAQFTAQIRNFLGGQRNAAQRQVFVDSLRAKAKVEVHLEAPPVFRSEVVVDGAPVRGDVKAPVTIVEFSDFHCPFCRTVQPTLLQLLAKYRGQVRLIYKHFPLDSLHPQARRASEASWCANEQGRFWEFHDRVYAAGPDASDATLGKFAADASLDKAAFDTCLASGRATAAIQKDVNEGTTHGINGTPGFFVNGRYLSGAVPLTAFENIIQEELKAAQ
jgi:protein-disulfide isomerase